MGKVEVSDLLGKPFVMGGRGQVGYDCYGLCLEVAKRAGIKLMPEESVEDLSLRSKIIDDRKALYEKLDKPEPFCLVTFKIRPPFVTHIGVVLADCKHFIHIMRKRSVAIERLDLPAWKRRLDGFYRFANNKNMESV